MKKNLGLLMAWGLIFGAFVLRTPDFASPLIMQTIFRQTIIAAFAAIGMTLIIVMGAIDLSVGSLVALVTVVIALALRSGVDPALAAMIGLGIGCAGGALNWSFMRVLRVGPFIVTLATLLAFRGVAKGLANEQSVTAPLTMLRHLTSALPAHLTWMGLPPGAWIAFAFAGLASLILRQTVLGRHMVAIGSNEATARMCGVRIERTRFFAFLLAGLCFGMAGLMQFSRLTIGDPTVASGLELSVIAAVVIGGASLNGGEGSVSGSLIGALIMTTIASGASHMGLPNWVQEIVTGAIILGAVALDRYRASRVARLD